MTDFAQQLESLFNEMEEHWLDAAPAETIITNEEVLREVTLPRGSSTRLCYFAVPLELLSQYRAMVFPLAEDEGLIAVASDDLIANQGAFLAAVASVVERTRIVIADVTTTSPQIHAELSALPRTREDIYSAVVATDAQEISEPIPEGAHIIRRPAEVDPFERGPDGEPAAWILNLQNWLQGVTLTFRPSIQDEALRLLDLRIFRSALISAVSAVEVALRESLVKLESVSTSWRSSKTGRPPGLVDLIQGGFEHGLIDADELEVLREAQHLRNRLVHSNEAIDGRKARPLVQRLVAIARRLSESA